MIITLIQYLYSVISGVLVGFSLGLIGGGGSILAIPLLLYFVGINDPHAVIGTTALAVGINAYINSISHWRRHNINLRVGLIFSALGVIGVLIGTTLGLLTKGDLLLFLFSFMMMGIGLYIFLTKCRKANEDVAGQTKVEKSSDAKVSSFGVLAGFASGFFGIGGGFLIVPSILYSSNLNMNRAVGTSLLAVGTFGMVTAIRYGIAGQIIIPVAILYVVGGIFGGMAGAKISSGMDKTLLRKIFAVIIVLVGIYMAIQNFSAI